MASLSDKVGEMAADIATIKATVETASPINQSQIDALFTARDEHTRRISDIERDYVRRSTHDDLERRTNRLELNVSKHIGWMMGIVAVLNFIGVGGMAVLVMWGGAK